MGSRQRENCSAFQCDEGHGGRGGKGLRAVFSDPASKGRPTYYPSAADELSILALPQGLILIGETETVDRGHRILTDLESQLEDPGEKVIFWYSCKHSNPEDIAGVLEKSTIP